jgi:DNA processing protein
VAASFLGSAGDTRTARLLRTLAEEAGSGSALALAGDTLLWRMATRLGVREGDRSRRIAEARSLAERTMAQARTGQVRWSCALSNEYPPRLWEISDPPIVLWTRGDVDLLSQPAVAVVGSRRASPSSLAVAFELGRELAAHGLAVVSGLARGVDGAAHTGALEAGGRTIAVLGSGVDVVYPPEHERLAGQVLEAGALVSEFPPGTEPRAYRFPLRNRVISGLSLAVVVIEAHERSGSLITARQALEQGRDVLAVPGGVASGRHRGGHALIKDGARLVETVDDVLEEIGWQTRNGPRAVEPYKHQRNSRLGETMAAGEAYSVDDLARLLNWSAAEVLAELSALELEDRVVRSGGEYFTKIDRRA